MEGLKIVESGVICSLSVCKIRWVGAVGGGGVITLRPGQCFSMVPLLISESWIHHCMCPYTSMPYRAQVLLVHFHLASVLNAFLCRCCHQRIIIIGNFSLFGTMLQSPLLLFPSSSPFVRLFLASLPRSCALPNATVRR